MRSLGLCCCALLSLLAGCRPREAEEAEQPVPLASLTLPLAREDYPWPHEEPLYEPIVHRFPAPPGVSRVELADRGWGQWLRHLPLKPPGSPVLSRAGDVILPGHSPVLGAVLDMDLRKNQECVDVILRLRAEYLRWAGREDEIVFNLTGEGTISWKQWKSGMRPRLEGSRLRFHKTAEPDASRATFDRYLASVFAWCGTYSLAQDGRKARFEDVRVGDFLVHGGEPGHGHAVLIADLARDEAGSLHALLLQGYMPAQSPHVLAPGSEDAWFALDPEQPLEVPRWGVFEWSELRGFTDAAP